VLLEAEKLFFMKSILIIESGQCGHESGQCGQECGQCGHESGQCGQNVANAAKMWTNKGQINAAKRI